MGHCQTCCGGAEVDDYIIRPHHSERNDAYDGHDNKSHNESNPVQSMASDAIWE